MLFTVCGLIERVQKQSSARNDVDDDDEDEDRDATSDCSSSVTTLQAEHMHASDALGIGSSGRLGH